MLILLKVPGLQLMLNVATDTAKDVNAHTVVINEVMWAIDDRLVGISWLIQVSSGLKFTTRLATPATSSTYICVHQ